MVKISKYLDSDLVLFLDVPTRDEVLQELVSVAKRHQHLHDSQVFYDALINREKVVTTGIGMGVAIPHAKLHTLEHFFIVLGILKKGVDWKALDGAPVRLVFMIGGPDDKQTEYLRILSGLTSVLKDEERRKKIVTAATAAEVLDLLNIR